MSVEVITTPQGTEEWHALRNSGGPNGLPLIGSSDLPIIMGVSPWKTPWRLWREKTGKQEPDAANAAMQQGNEREPLARMRYEMAKGYSVPPCILLDRDNGFIASLDGRPPQPHFGPLGPQAEFKCPGEKDHSFAVSGKVPPKYVPQLAWQLYLGHQLGDTESHYVSLAPDDSDIAVVPFHVDAALKLYWEIQMLPAVRQFQEWVRTDTEPPLDDMDRVLVDDLELEMLASQLRLLNETLASLQERYKILEGQLKDAAVAIHPRTEVAGCWVTQYKQSGATDWQGAYEATVAEVKRLAIRVYELEDIIGEGHGNIAPIPEPSKKPDKRAVRVTIR